MSPDIVKVSPAAIQWKVSLDLLRAQLSPEAWRQLDRHAIAETDKHQAIVEHFVQGRPWEETSLFTDLYPRRLAEGHQIRGCSTMPQLIRQYYDRVDALFAHLQAHGFLADAEAAAIPVYVAHDNQVLLGNQGNHRLAMAKVLNLTDVIVRVVGRDPASTITFERSIPAGQPDLPVNAETIPAMTTTAERQCYYRWARAQAPQGAVVELGAWLGAATVYLAAGVRDAGETTKLQVFDRFVWKPSSHDKKAGGPIKGSQLDAFRRNLGPLMAHVTAHASEISRLAWRGGRVSLLVCDAPKRIPEISSVLTAFAKPLQAGAVMAWQDFAYFPSYDIPAALMRLGDHVEFIEAVYPGTTAVFRVVRPWSATAVSPSALALTRWSADEVRASWAAWGARLPEPMRPRFACGAAMFLCDLGAVDQARTHLAAIVAAHPDEVLPKWRYLIADRAGLMQRYRPLLEEVARCA